VGRLRLLIATSKHHWFSLPSPGRDHQQVGIERSEGERLNRLVGGPSSPEGRSESWVEHVDHRVGEGREAHGGPPCNREDRKACRHRGSSTAVDAIAVRIAAMACSRTPKCR